MLPNQLALPTPSFEEPPAIVPDEPIEETDYTEAPAADILPPKLKDPSAMKKFAEALQMMCQASDRQLEDMKPIWKQVDDAQKNNSPDGLKSPYEGAPRYHFPVAEPNLDKGRAFIVQPLTKANPFVLVHAGGPAGSRSGRVETPMHLFMSRANYPRWLRMAIDVAQRRGKSTIRLLYEAGEELPNGREVPPAVRMDVFSPEHRIRYPNWAVRWEDALCDGTRWTCTIDELRSLQDEGYYLKTEQEIPEGQETDALPESFVQNREDDAVDPDHTGVTMRDVWVPGWLVGETGRDRSCRYRVWFHLNSCEVLRVEKWMGRRPPLFDIFLHEEYNRWLSERSRARSINGPQMYANDIRNLFVWSTLYQVTPTAFAIGGGLGLPNTAQTYKPGTVVPLQGAGQLTTLQARMDMTPFPTMIELARQDAELASHLGLQAHGIKTGGGTTATEINRTGLGQDVGVDEDVAYVNVGIAEMAEYLCGDILWMHFLDWMPWFMDSLPQGIRRDDFSAIYYFQTNGEIATDTPEAVLAQTAQLTQAVASLMALNPNLALRYPDLVPGLLRAAVDAANRGNMDSLLPSPEEEETMRAQEELQLGSQLGIPPLVGRSLQSPGLALPPINLS